MNRPLTSPQARRHADLAVPFDAGLRRHMIAIYNHMGLGLLVTAGIAAAIASRQALYEPLLNTPLKWLAIFAPLAFVLFMSFRFERMTLASLRATFVAFSAVMGVSMASLFLIFTGASIAQTFLIAATAFLGLSLWGYTTGRDLSRWSTFLLMGLIGVIAAALVNLFVASSALHLAVSLVGVIVFAGLTAWDTQRAKSDYLAYAGTPHAAKLAVMAALSLYLNLVNLFQLMLAFTGQRQGA